MADGFSSGPGEDSGVAEAEHSRRQSQLSAKAIHEGIVLRLAELALGLIVMIGLMLDTVISYAPAFPLIVVVASILCCTAAVRAHHYARLVANPGQCVGGLLYTAFIGSVVNLLFSGIATLMAALHVAAQATRGSSSTVLLNVSWPAVAISMLAIALAIRVTRELRRNGGR